MKNAKQITLSGITFSIEIDAYKLLNKYFEDIEAHFESSMNDVSADILQDIESSIAEKMIARGRGVQKAITLKDVQEIKDELGRVSEMDNDIASQNNTEEEKSETKNITDKRRRLYRDTDDIVIAGVASGLAKYFNIDVAFVRIIFLVGMFMSSIGFWIYIILWIAVQKAETSEQKMAMRGEDVNLESLKSYVNDKIQDIPEKTRGGVKGVADSTFAIVKNSFNFFIKRLLPIVKNIVGVLLIIVGAVGIFAVIIIILAYFKSGFDVVMDPVTAQYFGNSIMNASLWSVAVLSIVVLVPFWFFGMFGNFLVSFKRGKNKKLPVIEIVVLLMLWVVAMVYSSVYITTNMYKVESYISTIKKEIQKSPNAEFYVNIVDEDDKSTVLDLNLRNSVLKIQDDEDVIFVPFGNNNKTLKASSKDYEISKMWDSLIEKYLLSQKDFVWETESGSKKACVFEMLEEEKDFIFPIAIWSYCQEYKIVDGKVEELSGASLPVLLDYPKKISSMDISFFTHRIPRDGSLYGKDIKIIFSKEAQKKIFSHSIKNELENKMKKKVDLSVVIKKDL